MAEQRERIVLEVDEKGAVTAVSSANREVAKLEASFYRAGQTMEQRLLARIATMRQQMSGDPARLKELDALQERVLGRMQSNLAGTGKATKTMGESFRGAVSEIGGMVLSFGALEKVMKDVVLNSAVHAARTETMAVALRASAKANNLNLSMIQANEQALKKRGIATMEARQALLRMVTAEIDMTKATELGRLAQNAAVVGLMNSSEAFEHLIYGIQSGQVRVLRTIGINVDFQESYQRLARQLGKTTLELSDQEKVQARVNEVLRVAPRFAGLYEEAMGSVGKQMTSLKRYFDEASDAVGEKFQPALRAAVGTLTEFLKLIEHHPELGVALSLAATGGLAGLATKFMFGATAGRAVAIGGAVVGAATLTQKVGEGIGEKAAMAMGLPGRATIQFRQELPGIMAQQAAQRVQDTVNTIRQQVEESSEQILAKSFDRYLATYAVEESLKKRLSAAEKEREDAAAKYDATAHRAATARIAQLKEQLELLEANRKIAEKMTDQLQVGREAASQAYFANLQRSHEAMEILREQRLPQNLPTTPKEIEEATRNAEDWRAREFKRNIDLQSDVLKVQIATDEKRIQASDDFWEELAERERQRQQQRFDEIKRGFEGLFDAALIRAQGFWDAMKNLADTFFLTPIKDAFGNMMASFATGRGYGGGGGLATALGGSFGGGMMPSLGGFGVPGAPGGTGGFTGPVAMGGPSGGGGASWGNWGAAGANYLSSLKSFAGIGGSVQLGPGMATTWQAATMGQKLSSIGHSNAALLGGGLLTYAGLRRGGWSGMGMTAAGGALVGFKYGGPLGAAIGGIAGAAAGFVRMFIKGAKEKAREKIKAVHGVDIQANNVLEQIVQMARQSYGGNLDMAIRAQEVVDLIELYAMSTGQSTKGMPARMQPANLVQSAGGLYQQGAGGTLTNLGSSAATAPGGGTIVIPLQIDSKPIGSVIIENGRVVAEGAITAMKANAGRRELTALQLAPGTLTS